MTLHQRLSPAGGKGQNPHTSRPRLLDAHQVPSWYAHNIFLLSGYRPVNGSVGACIDSLRSVHNETVNIYTHLIPAILAFVGNCVLHLYFHARYPATPQTDRLAVHLHLTTSLLCFSISSIYHTMNCHSESYSSLWARWDYAAIILQTMGSFASGIYVTFYCDPNPQKIYWTITFLAGIMSMVIVVNPRFQSNQWRKLRITTFVAMGLSGLLPIIHAAFIYPFAMLNQQAGLGYYLVEGLALITGTVFYATHFPESWAPKTFDIWGASHQIFHIFVALASAIHILGLLSVFDWIDQNPRCPI
ncbi:adiponectin receptor protein [Stachybotrys elegans]|uniref:Adiponectin receptor protein n=1 Tax=Stachybotrys elegans TaxID=80388 RepID=A0A8K0SF53_9HYPO|nr:adiponectin receptor protein [Stachybotrys elegans]